MTGTCLLSYSVTCHISNGDTFASVGNERFVKAQKTFNYVFRGHSPTETN